FVGSWRGFTVRGYVDRVDDGREGLVVTDYKTGKSMPLGGKNSRGEPKLDLQLPPYVATAAKGRSAAQAAVPAARNFSPNAAATISESKSDEAELQHFMQRAVAMLQRGEFPVDPDAEQKVCAYCEFDAVCRRGPRLGRKRRRADGVASEAAEAAPAASHEAGP